MVTVKVAGGEPLPSNSLRPGINLFMRTLPSLPHWRFRPQHELGIETPLQAIAELVNKGMCLPGLVSLPTYTLKRSPNIPVVF